MSLSAGTRLGAYEVLGPLGAGGMGEVYRARDARLSRDVAIKVLPAEVSADRQHLSRFEKEARAASALNHPNIVTIHQIGETGTTHFLVMELVDGRTLREMLLSGPLPVSSALDIARQVATGLARAHEAGIVHRDLKPENLMARRDGLIKILDFGLAKQTFIPSGGDASSLPTETATVQGVIMGTLGYLSPEQARGFPADFHSDQFSFGAVLYEMAAGKRAFERQTGADTLSAILHEEPEPLERANPRAPRELQRIVERCLAKDPEQRYASTADLARELERLEERVTHGILEAPPARPRTHRRRALWIGALVFGLLAALGVWRAGRAGRPSVSSTPAAAPSIAILPFQTLGVGAEEDYFSDGMTEAIITEVAKARGLLVVARNSVARYKGQAVDVKKVGEELKVRYVLEGSLQRAGDRLRVHTQLIDVPTGFHLWAERYDRAMKDVFVLQDDIASNIATALKVQLKTTEPGLASSPPTENLEAYEAYLRGRFVTLEAYTRGDGAGLDRGIALLERATTLDPQFAPAHAELGRNYVRKYFGYEPKEQWREKAYVEIQKALALDTNLPDAYVARARLTWTLDKGFPHEAALEDLRRALQLNPSHAGAHGEVAQIYWHVGFLTEALDEASLALRLDQTLLGPAGSIARVYLYEAKYGDVLALYERYPGLVSDAHTNGDEKVRALTRLGRDAEASRRLEEILQRVPEAFVHFADRAVLRVRAGDQRAAEEDIARAIRLGQGFGALHHAEYSIATAYALMGKKREALDWLKKTVDDGLPCYTLYEKDPLLDSLRGYPEFKSFLKHLEEERERFRASLLPH
ncbi:MAG: protein kinase domain-containing protein [Thermoanaerobaculia bacterium]